MTISTDFVIFFQPNGDKSWMTIGWAAGYPTDTGNSETGGKDAAVLLKSKDGLADTAGDQIPDYRHWCQYDDVSDKGNASIGLPFIH